MNFIKILKSFKKNSILLYFRSDSWACPEQRSSKFSQNVIVYKYLIARKISDSTLKARLMDHMSTGYQYLISHYSSAIFKLWNRIENQLWMTAYAMKILGQAKTVLSIDMTTYIRNGLEYLKGMQGQNGGYEGHNSISETSFTSKIKQQGITMTAFVMIAFLENSDMKGSYQDVIDRGLNYISTNVANTNDNYANAISAYAFALADRTEDAKKLLQTLNNHAISENNMKHWVDRQSGSKAANVEITSYVLLTYAKLNNLLDAVAIESWLLNNRNGQGGFESTFCTVLGLQALAEIGKFEQDSRFNAHIQFQSDLGETFNFPLNFYNFPQYQEAFFQPKTRAVTVSANKTDGKIYFLNKPTKNCSI